MADDYSADTSTSGLVTAVAPVVGVIEEGGDKDWFRVVLTAGDTYRFDLTGAPDFTLSNTYLELRNAAGGLITFNDDEGPEDDARIASFVAPTSGTYYLAAMGKSASLTGTYRLTVSQLALAQADDFGQSAGTSGVIAAGVGVVGAIESTNDFDWLQAQLTAGHLYRFDLEGRDSGRGSLADPFLQLYDDTDTVLGLYEDGGTGNNSLGFFQPGASGAFWLEASISPGSGLVGTYRLSLTDLGVFNPLPGNDTSQSLTGGAGADYIQAKFGADTLRGQAGDDLLDGGPGIDTAVYGAASANYEWWGLADNTWRVKSLTGAATDGLDTLYSVEKLQFGDKTVTILGLTDAEKLTAAYSNILRSTASGAELTFLNNLIGAVNGSTKTLGAAITEIVGKADQTTAVAAMSYQFFLNFVPSKGGFDYLVSPQGPNANNINSAYYQSFNIENRYINFAVNLGKAGEGAPSFLAEYGSKTLFQATKDAYMEIFGGTVVDSKINTILDSSVGSMSRAQYFALYGGDGLTGIGTKAAMVGWLLTEAAKADLGLYAQSSNAFLTDLADGAQTLVDVVGVYGKSDYIFNG